MTNSDQKSFSAAVGCVECEFGGGVAILDTRSNMYYSMNEVGRFIWQQVQTPATPSTITKLVADEFEVDPSVCGPDVDRLLASLESNGLVKCT